MSQQEIPIPYLFESHVSLPWLLWHIIKTSLPSAKLKTYPGEKGQEETDASAQEGGQELYCTAQLVQEPRRARLDGLADEMEGGGPRSNLVHWSHTAWFC